MRTGLIFAYALLLALLTGCSSEARPPDLAVDTANVEARFPDVAAPDHRPPDARSPSDAFTPLGGQGILSGDCGVLDDDEWSSSAPFLFRNTIDFGSTVFDPAKLSPGGQQIWTEGNLGGSSINSEIFSFEVLHRCELAQLLKSETKITYVDAGAGGKKTDILMEIDARKVGVSVTRAYHYPPTQPYTEAEAKQLLDKKLGDLPLSRAGSTAQDRWVRSILHVLAYDPQHADAVQAAWDRQVTAEVKGNAILMLTVTEGNDEFIY